VHSHGGETSGFLFGNERLFSGKLEIAEGICYTLKERDKERDNEVSPYQYQH
jgi:hypothetical protein